MIEIEIQGYTGIAKKMNALVDSGFNGSLQIPFADALPLGLVLTGSDAHTLADGSMTNHLVCAGQVNIDGKSAHTPIDIQSADIVLLGTELLKRLGKVFVLDTFLGIVEITDSPSLASGK